jgi:hypothetical protein
MCLMTTTPGDSRPSPEPSERRPDAQSLKTLCRAAVLGPRGQWHILERNTESQGLGFPALQRHQRRGTEKFFTGLLLDRRPCVRKMHSCAFVLFVLQVVTGPCRGGLRSVIATAGSSTSSNVLPTVAGMSTSTSPRGSSPHPRVRGALAPGGHWRQICLWRRGQGGGWASEPPPPALHLNDNAGPTLAVANAAWCCTAPDAPLPPRSPHNQPPELGLDCFDGLLWWPRCVVRCACSVHSALLK